MTVALSATVHTLLAIRTYVRACACVCARTAATYAGVNWECFFFFPQRVFGAALQSVFQISGSGSIAVPHLL